MGFMGFGMQKWIYTMRPRKPFSMQRKGSFTAVPSKSRKFKLQPSENKGSCNLAIVLLIIFSLLIGLMIPKWSAYENKRINAEIEFRESRNNTAFNFLIKSGKNRLSSGKIHGAYSEFTLALNLKPNNKELNSLLLETLEILCFDYNTHCDELEELDFN